MRPVSDKRWRTAQQHEWAYQEGKSADIRGCEPQVIAGGRIHAADLTAMLGPHMRLTASTRILEVGSGPDGVCFFFKEGKRFGLDPLADVYRRPFSALQADSGVRLIRGQGERLPFPAEVFDLVLCENVLDHARDPESVIGEIHRVLRPGGAFFLSMNISPWTHRAASRVHERLLGWWMLLRIFSPHPFYLSVSAIRRLVRHGGFRVGMARLDPHIPAVANAGSFTGALRRRLAALFVHSGFLQLIALKS